jgi:hypothetical protein
MVPASFLPVGPLATLHVLPPAGFPYTYNISRMRFNATQSTHTLGLLNGNGQHERIQETNSLAVVMSAIYIFDKILLFAMSLSTLQYLLPFQFSALARTHIATDNNFLSLSHSLTYLSATLSYYLLIELHR